MCGIIGTWDADTNRDFVKDNIKDLKNRGPDGQGIERMGIVEFGHTRLAIQDLDPINGRQPMYRADSEGENTEVMITYNGELWNPEEIINLIRDKVPEYKQKTKCDTEIVLDFYMSHCREDPTNLKHLNGMFALAIYDRLYENKILFRDCIGEKPLYFTDDCFSSKQFLLSKTKKYCKLALMSVMSLGYSDSVFEDVVALQPGQMYLNGKLIQAQDLNQTYHKQCYTDFKYNLKKSIHAKIGNMDVPFALCLSGGLDSSLLLAEIKEMSPEIDLTTITIGFERDDEDVVNARMLAEKYNTKHHEILIMKDDLLERIPDLVKHIDSPIELGSMLLTYVMAEKIKNDFPEIKVVILGEGADEMFFGYKRHMEAQRNGGSSYLRRIGKMNIGLKDKKITLKEIRKIDLNFELVDYHMKRIDMIFSEFGIEARCPFLYKDLIETAVNSDPSENINEVHNKIWIRHRLQELKVGHTIQVQGKRPLKLFQDMDEVRMKILLEFNKRCKNAQ